VDIEILYLVDRLENLIASSPRIPLVNRFMVKEADILSIIDQMRASIPDEIKQARRIIQDKERILTQAQADANKLTARAREETERALHREGLLRSAEARSQEILQLAEEKSEQLKVEADAFVAETLRALRDHLSSIEMEVGRSILSIEKGLASLELLPEDEEGDKETYDEDQEELEEVEPPARPIPRRASLAADTLGGPTHQQDPKLKKE
jgi:hypothetical protein